MDIVLLNSFNSMLSQFILFVPTLIAIILLIIIGSFLGKALGKIGANFLDRIGVDDLISKTIIGDMIKRTGSTIVSFLDALIRWFVYIVFALIIIDLLNIDAVASFVALIITYIPLIVSALIILIIGLLVVDFLADLINNLIIAAGIDEKINNTTLGSTLTSNGLKTSSIVSGIFRIFGYLIFILAALNILQLTIVANLVQDLINYLPHLFAGILIILIGLIGVDFFVDYLENTMKGMNVEYADIMIPAFRGILSLVVMLVALDSMMIDTSIFYVILGPIAWGIAAVVAFKWGLKDAIVAYAKERK